MSPTQLQVTLAAPAEAPHSSAMLAAEVIGPALGEVRRMALQTGETTIVDVVPGSYLVRVTCTDGAMCGATIEVAEGESGAVTLSVPQWRPSQGIVRPGTEFPTIAPPSPGSAEPQVWSELWRGTAPIAWTGGDGTGPQAGRWTLSYDGMSALHHVVVGGVSSAWRTIALPPAQGTGLTVAPVAARGDFDDGLHVEVDSGDARARAMVDYLSAGRVEQAQVVAVDVVEMAVRAFQDKLVHPEGAAVAGYLLLRMKESDRLRDWGQNFANWFEWLPDAQVIHAGQLLNRPGAPDRALARTRLLKAAELGAPRYTEGLRLLFEGLQALAGTDQQDQPVRDALEQVRAYANACDWSATMTTYWCRSPQEPSLERRTGWPDGSPHVARLA